MVCQSNEDKTIFKIADFGLSKIISPHERAFESMGTLPYAAPEIVNDMAYSKLVDIWSLGVMTYYLVARVLPFDDSYGRFKYVKKKIISKEVDFSRKQWEEL